MSRKFKIGDKVKLVNVELAPKYQKEYAYLGEVATISDYRGYYLYEIDFGYDRETVLIYESGLELVKDETFPENWYVRGGEEFADVLLSLEAVGFTVNVSGMFETHFYYLCEGFSIEPKHLTMRWNESNPPQESVEITPEQFKQYVLNHKEEKEMKKTQKISREGLGELYNNVCSDWQSKIMSIIVTDKFANEFEVDENLIKQAYNEANEAQTLLLDKYFTKPEKKFEPFEVTVKVNTIEEAHFLFRLANHHYPSEKAIEKVTKEYREQNPQYFEGTGISNCVSLSVDIYDILEKSGQK